MARELGSLDDVSTGGRILGSIEDLSPEQKFEKSRTAIETEISKRPSMIKSLIEDPWGTRIKTPFPLGTPTRTLMDLGRGTMGAFEGAAGTTADIGLALQRGKPEEILGDIGKTLTGQRPSQLSDVYRASGLPGISNPFFAIPAGMLLESTKFSPTGALGQAISGGVSGIGGLARKIPKVDEVATEVGNTLKGMANQYGKRPLATLINVLTKKVPVEHAEIAIDNPHYLNPKYVESEKQVVGQLFKKIIEPLEDNEKIMVDKKPMLEQLKNLRLRIGTQDPAPIMAKLNTTEKTKVNNWLSIMEHGNLRFRDARYVLSEMDDALSPIYKKARMGSTEPVTDAFQNITRQLRGTLRSTIHDENLPEANQALNRISKYYDARNVKNSFTGYNIAFFRALPAKILLQTLGMKGLPSSALAATLTMPSVWGGRFGLLRGTVGGLKSAKEVLSEPTVIAELIRKFGLEKPNQQTNAINQEPQ